jgi:hypothetical protein
VWAYWLLRSPPLLSLPPCGTRARRGRGTQFGFGFVTALYVGYVLGPHEENNVNDLTIVSQQAHQSCWSMAHKAFLLSLGLHETAVALVSETQKWSSGCGYYNFVDRTGRIAATIVAGDKKLAPERLRDCIVSGIIFGFGVRARSGATFDTSQGYIQYLALSSVMAVCDRRIGDADQPEPEEIYTNCITAELENRIAIR